MSYEVLFNEFKHEHHQLNRPGCEFFSESLDSEDRGFNELSIVISLGGDALPKSTENFPLVSTSFRLVQPLPLSPS